MIWRGSGASIHSNEFDARHSQVVIWVWVVHRDVVQDLPDELGCDLLVLCLDLDLSLADVLRHQAVCVRTSPQMKMRNTPARTMPMNPLWMCFSSAGLASAAGRYGA